jgi:hypothetical protein
LAAVSLGISFPNSDPFIIERPVLISAPKMNSPLAQLGLAEYLRRKVSIR